MLRGAWQDRGMPAAATRVVETSYGAVGNSMAWSTAQQLGSGQQPQGLVSSFKASR